MVRALLTLPLIALLTTLAPRDARAGDDAKPMTQPPAPPSEEASARFRSGVAFFKDKDFAAAQVEFKRAYELVPNFTVLFNIGQTARELKDYAAALSAFEKYLEEGGAKIPAARRKDVTAYVDELTRKVGRVKITASVDGAELAIDDVAVGVSPLAASVVVNVGRHKLSATSTGYSPAQRVVDVAGMSETPVNLELAKIDSAAVPVPGDPPRADPPKLSTPTIVWVMLGTTAAAGVAAGVTGGLAVASRGALKNALGTFPGDPAAITAAQGKTRTLAITTDILGGITVAGAVTTVVLYFVAPKTASKVEKAPVSLDVSPAGIGLHGRF
jgi:hypothetical protein